MRDESDLGKAIMFCAEHSLNVKRFTRIWPHTGERLVEVIRNRHKGAIDAIMGPGVPRGRVVDAVYMIERGDEILGVCKYNCCCSKHCLRATNAECRSSNSHVAKRTYLAIE